MSNETIKPQIPDDQWPEWATHAAYNANGAFWWLAGKVRAIGEGELPQGIWIASMKVPDRTRYIGSSYPNWRESLIENPKFIRQRAIAEAEKAVFVAAMKSVADHENYHHTKSKDNLGRWNDSNMILIAAYNNYNKLTK